MALGRFRVALGLDTRHPLLFLAGCTAIANGLAANSVLIPAPTPTVAALLLQIQEATTAQQQVGKVKGAAATRNMKFATLLTSVESERMMVQALCDASPEQAAAIIAAASMKQVEAANRVKALLALKNILPSGTVQATANARLLDATNRRKTYHWQVTLDGGKTYLDQPPTPVAKTKIPNLPPLTTVGVRVSVTAGTAPQSAWTDTVTILVR